MSINWNTIIGPQVLVDSKKAKRNIKRMQEKADAAKVTLRPHFKTHQSVTIGKWFGPPASTAIAVSSPTMANMFAAAGWQDILLAIPLNPRALPAYNRLAGQVNLGLTIESKAALSAIERLQNPVDVYIEIDAGYGRTGISWRQHELIAHMLTHAGTIPHVRQLGLLLHAGNSYNARGDIGIAEIHHESLQRLQQLLTHLPNAETLRISVGDTPTCSRMHEFPGADEIRPGNYVFYDWQQQRIGACEWSDIALAVACPIIAIYPERGEVVVHGGAVHFSKDWAMVEGKPVYGQVVHQTAHGWGGPIQGAQLISVSQEHGKVRVPEAMLKELNIGDLLIIVPAHSCLVMAAFNGECVVI